ncbi:MAG: ABC transporter substrate-binding protein [Fusobacteriaceae bacterium]
MNKKFIFIFAFILLTISCSKQKKNNITDKTLVISQGADPRSLDPHKAIDTPSVRVYSQIYDQLVRHNINMEIEPNLAKNWTWENPTEIIFNLEENVRFHNGDKLTASDVKFSLERMFISPTVSFLINEINKIEVINETTIKITTKQPFGPLLSHLAHPGAGILNEKHTNSLGAQYGISPMGTGPFKFSEWIPGDNVKLVSNLEYYRGTTPIKNIMFKNIVEGNNRTIGLETKELDISYDVEPMDINIIKNEKDLSLLSKKSLGTAYLGLNMNKKPFNQKEIRQAIAYSLDAESIEKIIYNGAATIADSPLSPQIKGYKSSRKYNKNILKAKELLSIAGYPHGFKMKIWVNDSQIRKDIATIFQAQLKEVGIDVIIETMEWGSYLEATARGEHDSYLLGWSTVTGDADYGLYPLFHSSNFGRPGNRSFYKNEKVDTFLEEARATIEVKKRIELYEAIQDIIQEELPIITFVFVGQNVGINTKVLNFNLHPTGYHELYQVDTK